MARRDPARVRLLTRNGNDWTPRYPLIFEAMNRLKVRSCLIDGEAVACDANGLTVFDICAASRLPPCAALRLRPAGARRRGSAARAVRDPQGDARELATRGSVMERREAFLLVDRLKRRTRDPDVLTLCEYVHGTDVHGTIPAFRRPGDGTPPAVFPSALCPVCTARRAAETARKKRWRHGRRD